MSDETTEQRWIRKALEAVMDELGGPGAARVEEALPIAIAKIDEMPEQVRDQLFRDFLRSCLEAINRYDPAFVAGLSQPLESTSATEERWLETLHRGGDLLIAELTIDEAAPAILDAHGGDVAHDVLVRELAEATGLGTERVEQIVTVRGIRS